MAYTAYTDEDKQYLLRLLGGEDPNKPVPVAPKIEVADETTPFVGPPSPAAAPLPPPTSLEEIKARNAAARAASGSSAPTYPMPDSGPLENAVRTVVLGSDDTSDLPGDRPGRASGSEGTAVVLAPPIAPVASAEKPPADTNKTPYVSVQPHVNGTGGADEFVPPPVQYANVPAQTIPEVSPEVRQMFAMGEEAQLGGMGAQADVEAQRADEVARAKDEAAEQMRLQQVLDAQSRDTQRQALEDHLAQLQAKADAVARKQVDPEHYMKNLSTGDQIRGIIAMALGGFAQGFSDGRVPNVAAEMVNQNINRDIEAQVQNINKDQRDVQNATGIYADKYRLFDDADKARAAARQEMLANAMMQIDGLAAKYDSPLIRARAEQMKGELAVKFGEMQTHLEKYVPAHVAQVGTAGTLSNIKPETVVVMPNGQRVSVSDTGQRENIEKLNTAAMAVRSAGLQLKRLASVPFGQRNPLTTHGQEWARDYDAALEQLSFAEQAAGGKGGKGMLEANMKIADRKVFFYTPSVGHVVDTITSRADATRDAAIAASNPVVVHEVPNYVNPKTKEQERRFIIQGPYKPPQGPSVDAQRSLQRPAGQ